MAKKKREPVDDLLDALMWMRRKAKKHEPVDDLIDALMRMRRKTTTKTAKRSAPAKRKKAPARNPTAAPKRVRAARYGQ